MSKKKIHAQKQSTAKDSVEVHNTTSQSLNNQTLLGQEAREENAHEKTSSILPDAPDDDSDVGAPLASRANIPVKGAADDQDESASEDPSDDDEQNIVAKLERNWGQGCVKAIFNNSNWLKGQHRNSNLTNYHENDLAKWRDDTQQALLKLSRLTKNNLRWVKEQVHRLWGLRDRIREVDGVKLTIGRRWAQKDENICADVHTLIERARKEFPKSNAGRSGTQGNGGPAQDVGGGQRPAEPGTLGRTRGQTAARTKLQDMARQNVETGGKKAKGKGKKVDSATVAPPLAQGRTTTQDDMSRSYAPPRETHGHFEQAEGEQFGTQDEVEQQDEDEAIAGPSRNAPRQTQGQVPRQQSQPTTARRPAASASEIHHAENALEDAQHKRRMAKINLDSARTNRARASQENGPYNKIVEADSVTLENQLAYETSRQNVVWRKRELEDLKKEPVLAGRDDEMEE